MSIHPVFTRFRATCCWGLLVVLCLMSFAAPSRAGEVYYTEGHGDIGVAYEDGGLHLHYHFGSNAVINGFPLGQDEEFDPADVITVVPEPTFLRPAGSQWDFVGTAAGEKVWYLPQGSEAGRPFLGFAAEEGLESSDWQSAIVFSLVAVDGPGAFSLWQNTMTGPKAFATSAPGFDEIKNEWSVGFSHDHFNFGFTKPGDYLVTIRAAGTLVTGEPLFDEAGFRFQVVPEPSTLALVASASVLGSLALLRRRRRPTCS